MKSAKFLFWGLLILLSLLPTLAQAQAKDSHSPGSPTPEITGRLIGTHDGQLILEYNQNSVRKTFIGTINSTCMIPAKSNSSEPTPLNLSGIPKGSQLTAFYVRHTRKLRGMERAENTILAIRFDRLNGESVIPKGQMIPCYKAAPTPAPK